MVKFDDQTDVNLTNLMVWEQYIPGRIGPVVGITACFSHPGAFPGIKNKDSIAESDTLFARGNVNDLSPTPAGAVCGNELHLEAPGNIVFIQSVHLIQYLAELNVLLAHDAIIWPQSSRIKDNSPIGEFTTIKKAVRPKGRTAKDSEGDFFLNLLNAAFEG